jgi:hypothetical protein
MKTILSFVFIINTLIFSQPDSLLEKLDGENWYYRFEALNYIQKNRLEEYIPELESRIFNQETLQLQEAYLVTLNALDAENTYDFAIQYYSSIDSFNSEPHIEVISKLQLKASVQYIFFKYGDYSRTEDIFTYLDDPNETKFYGLIIHDLKTVYENVPSFQTQALDWLLYILNETTDIVERKIALKILHQINYTDVTNICVNIINNQTEDGNLKYFAARVLFTRHYAGLPDIFREKINDDPSDVLRWRFASGLLEHYAVPSDLKLVIDHIPNETNEDVRGMFEIIVDLFIPPKPVNLGLDQMIANLISYTNDLVEYGWIADWQIDYMGYLLEMQEAIENERYEELCNTIEMFLPEIEQAYEGGDITKEGYKFLHYHTTYIKEKYEEEFGPCP